MKNFDRHKKPTADEPAYIVSYFSGVAKIRGLPQVFLHEVLIDKQGRDVALVIGFDENFVEVLFFREDVNLSQPVFRSRRVFQIRVSSKIVGRVISGLGEAVDKLGPLKGKSMTVFNEAPRIIDREPVSTALSTGIKALDAALPLGRGQRELIIGDRSLGKSMLALDLLLNQKKAAPPVYCVYVLIGQKEQKVQEIIQLLERKGAFLYSMIVAAPAASPYAAQYLAPFVGCAIAEYFRDLGHDALIIYDDLLKHAKTYRSIALLLERAPGRESYPGDIFSLHAGLLERAAKLGTKKGGGSLTALPIIETQEGDISSFISTNLISITDGQIYLDRDLFQAGFLPAINIGLSVSRVGSQSQPAVFKDIVGGIRLLLAQHLELQKLSQLEASISPETDRQLRRGNLLLELLKQGEHTNITWPEQAVLFYVIQNGFFDELPPEEWAPFEAVFLELLRHRFSRILSAIKAGKFNQPAKLKIRALVTDVRREFLNDLK